MSIFNSLQIQDSITIAIAVISILGVAFGMMSYLNNSNKTKTDKIFFKKNCFYLSDVIMIFKKIISKKRVLY